MQGTRNQQNRTHSREALGIVNAEQWRGGVGQQTNRTTHVDSLVVEREVQDGDNKASRAQRGISQDAHAAR